MEIFVGPIFFVSYFKLSQVSMKIFHYCNINTQMKNFMSWYNYILLILFLFPIPIHLFFHNNEVFISDCQFTWISYLTIGGCVFLYFKVIRHILHNVISHCCVIRRIYSTIFTRLNQWCHIFTYAIKDNLMNIIKFIIWYIFIGKIKYLSSC